MADENKNSEDLVTKFGEHSLHLTFISERVFALGEHFYATGNRIVGLRLQNIAREILLAKRGMDDTHSALLMERVNAAFQHSENLLAATLAGAIIATDGNKGE